MFDIKEFNTRLLTEYGIIKDNNRMRLFNYLVGEFTNEIEEVSYVNLKTILESKTVSLLSKNKLIQLKKVSEVNSNQYKHELYIDLYYNEQSASVLSKRAILKDYNYGENGTIYTSEIKILEFDGDGSVIFIKVTDKSVRNGFGINAKYYNPETAELIGAEKENIDVYDLLDNYSIHCDKEIEDVINSYSFEIFLTKIEECKDSLKDDKSMRKEKDNV